MRNGIVEQLSILFAFLMEIRLVQIIGVSVLIALVFWLCIYNGSRHGRHYTYRGENTNDYMD